MRKSDTREKILEAALALFRERGFEAATMREIAARAEVASGLAYYYFDSKDAIVLAFYQRAMQELPERLEAAHQERRLADRLRALILEKFAYFLPNRRFLGALMGHVADPSSPLSPFSDASRDIRAFDVAHFERAIADTRTRVPQDLQPHLAKLLWFYHLGLLLFWIYDRSPHQRRSQALLDASLKIVVRLLQLSNVPLLKPARQTVIEVLAILES